MRIACIFLLTSVVAAAQTSTTLHQKYGQPTSDTYDRQPVEIYKVRADIKVTVRYTKHGDICSMFIAPLSEMTNGKPSLLKSDALDEVIDELVPKGQRGKYLMGTFLNITCLPKNDCYGTEENYQRVLIHKHGSIDAHPYASISWKSRACAQRAKGNARQHSGAQPTNRWTRAAGACFVTSLMRRRVL
jgi:hypothetical protein